MRADGSHRLRMMRRKRETPASLTRFIDNIVKPVSKARVATKVIFPDGGCVRRVASSVSPDGPARRSTTSSPAASPQAGGYRARRDGANPNLLRPASGAAFPVAAPDASTLKMLVKRHAGVRRAGLPVNTGWNGDRQTYLYQRYSRDYRRAILDGSLWTTPETFRAADV